MLEHIPHWLGSALGSVRAGADKLTITTIDVAGAANIRLFSPAFASGARLPERFTADGEGVSPPLVWGELPEGTQSLALIVEDRDAPAPRPLVHAVVAGIDPAAGQLAEGAVAADVDAAGESDGDTGRNSYFREGWLPPDPPTGHGAHAYVFQLFALSEAPDMDSTPGRGELRDSLDGRVIGAGVLVGTYSRGEEAPVGPAAAALATS